MWGRSSARSFEAITVSRDEVSAVLNAGFGISRENTGTDYPRPFRVAPSGGALYPIEPFVFCSRAEDIDPGLYHFDSSRSELREVTIDPLVIKRLPEAFLQPDLVAECSLLIIMAAFFERSTFKYGERAYRFVLIEAGHIGQNIALAATGLGLPSVVVGGFIDSRIDRLLELDGFSQSVIYTALIGGPRKHLPR